MRLKPADVSTFISVISEYLSNETAELRLYGSRVDDSKKGGDIDLLLVVENKAIVKKLTSVKAEILVAIKKQIGEQKIDLLIVTPNELETDPFLQIILPTSITLHHGC